MALRTHIRPVRSAAVLLAACSLLTSTKARSSQESPTISPTASRYLDHALDLMQQHALHAQEIDWPALRIQTFWHGADAHSTVDTYPAGSFVSLDGTAQSHWSYRQGAAAESGATEIIDASVAAPPLSLPVLPPVAVLIDSGTISSGEAIAVSFAGRPQTRFFGART